MQTIHVKLEFSMRVPDDWRIVGVEQPEAGCLEVNNNRYEPGLMWMKVTNTGGDTLEAEQVDDDTHLMFMEHVTACTEDVNVEDPSGPNNTSEHIP